MSTATGFNVHLSGSDRVRRVTEKSACLMRPLERRGLGGEVLVLAHPAVWDEAGLFGLCMFLTSQIAAGAVTAATPIGEAELQSAASRLASLGSVGWRLDVERVPLQPIGATPVGPWLVATPRLARLWPASMTWDVVLTPIGELIALQRGLSEASSQTKTSERA